MNCVQLSDCLVHVDDKNKNSVLVLIWVNIVFVFVLILTQRSLSVCWDIECRCVFSGGSEGDQFQRVQGERFSVWRDRGPAGRWTQEAAESRSGFAWLWRGRRSARCQLYLTSSDAVMCESSPASWPSCTDNKCSLAAFQSVSCLLVIVIITIVILVFAPTSTKPQV